MFERGKNTDKAGKLEAEAKEAKKITGSTEILLGNSVR
mgnify:CR=1 FL=1